MSDLLAVGCFCGKAIACEELPRVVIFRHEVRGVTEEITLTNMGAAELEDQITEWILEIHGYNLHTEGTSGEAVRAPRVQYRFPHSTGEEEVL